MAICYNIRKIFLIFCFCCINCYICLGQTKRDSIELTFQPLVNKTELTGRNDGKEVEMVLKSCNLKKGNPYCAATVYWTFINTGVKLKIPNPAYCPNWFTDQSKVVYKKTWQNKTKGIKKGDVFGLYFSEMGRVAHVGIVIERTSVYTITFEGNTSSKGAIETDELTQEDREAGVNGGFFYKKRKNEQIYIIADYLAEYDNQNKDWRNRK